jgi:3-mercaptopyruvate sulfurtransferase SseA
MSRGIARVRPLEGGYDEWKRLGYPLAAVGQGEEPERLTR